MAYWIIGVVVMGLLFWLAVLALVVLLCFKRKVVLLSNSPTTRPSNITVDTSVKDEPRSQKDGLKEYTPSTFFQEVEVEVKKPELEETPPPPVEYNLTDTVNINNLPAEPEIETVYENTQTHSMVILDEHATENGKSPFL